MNTLQQKQKWSERYYKLKDDPTYRDQRKKRQKKYRDTRCFVRLVKSLKKKDNSSTITKFDLWRIAKKQIIPLCLGGKTDRSNIRLTVKEVNNARHYMEDNVFIKMCEDVYKYNKLSLT
jgi:hypothetical protein